MSPDPRIQQSIGRYRVLHPLGQGGMAQVLLARDDRFNRDVAVKVLPGELLGSPDLLERFRREAETVARLEHWAIVPVYDYGEQDGQPYLVMRYLRGGTLHDRLRSGPLPVAEVVEIVDRIWQALDFAHEHGVVHRDVKPANILFDERGHAYLSDFGIAKLGDAAFTLTQGVIGTPAYMSPEQAQGDGELGPRSDVYSLGAVLFEALTGKVPYVADTPIGVALAHIQRPVPRILEAAPDLPPAVDVLVQRLMAKDPEERPRSPAPLLAQLMLAAREMVDEARTVCLGDATMRLEGPSTVAATTSRQRAERMVVPGTGSSAAGETTSRSHGRSERARPVSAFVGATFGLVFGVALYAGLSRWLGGGSAPRFESEGFQPRLWVPVLALWAASGALAALVSRRRSSASRVASFSVPLAVGLAMALVDRVPDVLLCLSVGPLAVDAMIFISVAGYAQRAVAGWTVGVGLGAAGLVASRPSLEWFLAEGGPWSHAFRFSALVLLLCGMAGTWGDRSLAAKRRKLVSSLSFLLAAGSPWLIWWVGGVGGNGVYATEASLVLLSFPPLAFALTFGWRLWARGRGDRA